MNFVDLGETHQVRVTFEADNNLDFRLGTGPLRGTKLAQNGDLAAITRRSEDQYELRIFKEHSPLQTALDPYALTFIGHQGKKVGYLTNSDFDAIVGIGRASRARVH